MEALEFVAKAEKGSIKIPKEYQNQLQNEFRVIILQELPAPKKVLRKKRSLGEPKIKTKGVKFNRDEANAR
jgi:hypothetical protein